LKALRAAIQEKIAAKQAANQKELAGVDEMLSIFSRSMHTGIGQHAAPNAPAKPMIGSPPDCCLDSFALAWDGGVQVDQGQSIVCTRHCVPTNVLSFQFSPMPTFFLRKFHQATKLHKRL